MAGLKREKFHMLLINAYIRKHHPISSFERTFPCGAEIKLDIMFAHGNIAHYKSEHEIRFAAGYLSLLLFFFLVSYLAFFWGFYSSY